MSDNREGFRSKVMSHLSLIENIGLSNVAIIEHTKWVSRCILKIVLETGKNEITQEQEIALKPVFDKIFDQIRENLITIFSSKNDIGELKEPDLQYIRSTLRLPENFNLNLLKKLLKGELESEEINLVISAIFDKEKPVDKDDCKNFLIEKLGLNEFSPSILNRLINGGIDNIELHVVLDMLKYVTNKEAKKFIVDMIVNKNPNSLDLGILSELLNISETQGEFIMWFSNLGRDSYDNLRKLVLGLKNNDKKTLYELLKFLGTIKLEYIELIFGIVLNDESEINDDFKMDVIRLLWPNFGNIIAKILGTHQSFVIYLKKYFLGEKELSRTDKYYIIKGTSSKKGKYLLFNIFFKGFSFKDLEIIIRSVYEDKKSSKPDFDKIRNEICDEFKELLGIPNIDKAFIETLRNVDGTTQSGKVFQASTIFSGIIGDKSEKGGGKLSSGLLGILGISQDDITKLQGEPGISIAKMAEIISKTHSYDGRKVLYEGFFIKGRGINIEYSQILDFLFKNGYIKNDKILSNHNLGLLLKEGNNPKVVENFEYIVRNSGKKTYDTLFSDFVVNFAISSDLEEIKEIFELLPKDNNGLVDLRGLAELLRKKESDKLVIHIDLGSLALIFKHFSLDYSKDSLERVKKLSGLLDIVINKNSRRIRENLKIFFEMFPSIKITDLENKELQEAIINIDSDILKFLCDANNGNFSKLSETFKEEIVNSFTRQINELPRERQSELKVFIPELNEIAKVLKFEIDLEGLIKNRKNPILIRGPFNLFFLGILRAIKYNIYLRQSSLIRRATTNEDGFKLAEGAILTIDGGILGELGNFLGSIAGKEFNFDDIARHYFTTKNDDELPKDLIYSKNNKRKRE